MRNTSITRCLALSVSTLALGGCANGPATSSGLNGVAESRDAATDDARKSENDRLRQRQDDERQILISVERSLQEYQLLRSNPSSHRNESAITNIRQYLVDVTENRYELLVRIAQDQSHVFKREFAVGVLGFSERPEVLGVLLQALLDEDGAVRKNAVFALGVRRDPQTPVAPLVRIVEDREEDRNTRIGTAWALYELQTALRDPSPILPTWTRLLKDTDTPPLLVMNAIRGLGQTRDPQYRELVERYASDPTPLVRMATAIALGRIRDQQSVPVLLDMMEEANTEPNVMLSVRKALQALAGRQTDFGEDLQEWRRHFERGA